LYSLTAIIAIVIQVTRYWHCFLCKQTTWNVRSCYKGWVLHLGHK